MKEREIAITAAKASGEHMLERSRQGFQVFKKSEIDLVTEVDRECQRLICEMISNAFPEDLIIAEEGEASKPRSSSRRWFVDPIDGTTNYAHGYPCFCTSIAFEEDGELRCGVIFDPTRNELFTAQQNEGAFVGETRLHCSSQSVLKDSLLVTGFPYELNDMRTNNLPEFNHLMMKAQAIRRDGSAALNLAYIAAGRFDGFWEKNLKAWDCAAGMLMVKEAGGGILAINENQHAGLPSDFVAGNMSLSKNILEELKKIQNEV